MNVQEFEKFWRLQGRRTTRGGGVCWYAVRPLVFLSLPYERIIQPTRAELLRLFFLTPALVLRYPTQASGVNGNGAGGVFVCEQKAYDFPALHARARTYTRKALRECTVERIEFSLLAKIGEELNRETWQRQGRGETELSRNRWQLYCEAATHTPDMEAWGAFVDGRLAAFAVCALVERCYNILHQSSSLELLAHHPNNALTFTVTKRALEQTRVDLVSYGLKSLEKTEGLDRFKLGMGFSIQPFDEHYALHPLLRICLALGGRQCVKWAATRRPDSDFWRKALVVCQMQRRQSKAAL